MANRATLPRAISYALRIAREREESDNLLGEEMPSDASGCLDAPIGKDNPNRHLPVYRNIHRIRRLILASIDDPYTLEQLMAPRFNGLLVRPLVDRLYDGDDISTVYCLLVNKQRFLRDQICQAHHRSVNFTRATLCELLASRVLRRFNEDNPTRAGLLKLANILVAGFEPFQNCPEDVLKENSHILGRKRDEHLPWERMTNALEIAIISESKEFLGATACQRVVDALYVGRIVYTPHSIMDIIPDHYKRRGVSMYDPRRAPLLNHYRLIVPRTRAVLEFLQFVVLISLYVMTMISRDIDTLTGWEIAFMLYSTSWCLDEVASILEHGWLVHTQNLWSFLDVSFVIIYTLYMAVRIHALIYGHEDISVHALDILACAAPIMFPRLAFNIMPENLLFIALRTMMRNFLLLSAVAFWCFCGFLFAMSWLSRWRGAEGVQIPPLKISKWMLWIWFGLDGTGIDHSVDFHLILGPILMISFAFLGNTLFLTILTAMLTNTFSKIAKEATKEIQFRRAVLTFEGVKADAIFAYRPPFNLLAVILSVPLRFLLTPRWFHKIHVTAARISNAPLLLALSLFERRYLWQKRRFGVANGGALRRRSRSHHLSWGGFSAHRDLQDVFDIEPPQAMVDEIEQEDQLDDDILELGPFANRVQAHSPNPVGERTRRRRFSSVLGRP